MIYYTQADVDLIIEAQKKAQTAKCGEKKPT